MRRSLLIVPAALVAFVALPAAAADRSVSIQELRYEPAIVDVFVGDTVTWTNRDTTEHTVTADDGRFDSGTLAPGATFAHRFTQAGSYGYGCRIHPSMRGTVRVAAPPGSTTTRPPSTTTTRPTTTTTRPVTTTSSARATTTSSTTSSTTTTTSFDTTTTDDSTTTTDTTLVAAPEISENDSPSALVVALLAAAAAAVVVGIGAVVRRMRAG